MAGCTRRFICRSTFVVLCVLPLCATVAYAAWLHVHWGHDGYERWVASQLGLDLHVAGTTHPQPYVVRLQGAQLLDSETLSGAAPLVEMDTVQVTQGKRILGVHVPCATVASGRFRRLLQVLHDRLLCQQRLLGRNVVVTMEHVRLLQSEEAIVIRDLRLEVDRGATGPMARLTFFHGQIADTEPVCLTLARDQSGTPAITRVMLRTGDGSLPCSLFVPIPLDVPVGDEVTFQGDLFLEGMSGGWKGTLYGVFDEIRFRAPAGSKSQFSGTARARIRHAEFTDGWMQRLEGNLVGKSGSVDREWLRRLADGLQLPAQIPSAKSSADRETALLWSDLAVYFQMGPEDTVLQGVSDARHRGAMLVSNGRTVVGTSQPHTLATLDVFRALFGLSRNEVPMATDALSLQRVVPLRR